MSFGILQDWNGTPSPLKSKLEFGRTGPRVDKIGFHVTKLNAILFFRLIGNPSDAAFSMRWVLQLVSKSRPTSRCLG